MAGACASRHHASTAAARLSIAVRLQPTNDVKLNEIQSLIHSCFQTLTVILLSSDALKVGDLGY